MLGVSPQDVDSHERFAAQEGFEFPLLADTDRAVGGEYGIASAKLYRRSVVIVDAAGIIRYLNVKLVGATWKTAKSLEGVLASI